MAKLKSVLLPIALLAGAGLVLSSCGRKGDLDPPSIATKSQDKFGQKSENQPPAPDKPFILDPLL